MSPFRKSIKIFLPTMLRNETYKIPCNLSIIDKTITMKLQPLSNQLAYIKSHCLSYSTLIYPHVQLPSSEGYPYSLALRGFYTQKQ